MKTDDFDYSLPVEFIAQSPVEPRDHSRLMILERKTGKISHAKFFQLTDYLNPGDLIVLNETRVIPARLYAKKAPGGGKAEILLLRRQDEFCWEALVGGKGLNVGRRLALEGGPGAEVLMSFDGSRRIIRFDEAIEPYLDRVGHMPLPPYIKIEPDDPNRYQTVFARVPGSAAAPTAGLHFTPGLFDRIRDIGVNLAWLTLHVGLDTFSPVTEDAPEDHRIHTEWCELSEAGAEAISNTKRAGGRVIAVGTTSVRTLESAARAAPAGQVIAPFTGPTDLYILPGYRFRVVDAMITNFHLPRSTLIMLVSAFAGRERILHAYEIAKQYDYRFYSFGDAMLIG